MEFRLLWDDIASKGCKLQVTVTLKMYPMDTNMPYLLETVFSFAGDRKVLDKRGLPAVRLSVMRVLFNKQRGNY